MQITDRELAAMTRELDEMHHASLPAFKQALLGYSETIQSVMGKAMEIAHIDSSRRNFLRGGLVTAGALGGGAILAACGDSSTSPASSSSGSTPAANADLDIARLAASIEVLAISTYGAALTAASSGALGKVPAALGAFVTTAKQQHTDHAAAWNALLKKGGQAEQTDPDPALAGTVQTQLAAVKTIPQLASLAILLENVALQTYVNGAGLITSKEGRKVALTIAPVEAQHAAILNFVAGVYPVPDTTVPKDKARTPADLKQAAASPTAK